MNMQSRIKAFLNCIESSQVFFELSPNSDLIQNSKSELSLKSDLTQTSKSSLSPSSDLKVRLRSPSLACQELIVFKVEHTLYLNVLGTRPTLYGLLW